MAAAAEGPNEKDSHETWRLELQGIRSPDNRGEGWTGTVEAAPEAVSDEAALARHAQTGCGAGDLLGQALARENVGRAWKRVKANKGSAGVDGRTVQDTAEYLRHAWPDIRQRVAEQAMHKLRERLRQLTRRVRGRSLEQGAQDLQAYEPGWKAYFRLAQTPKVMRELDEWLRHRLRALQLRQWRRGTTMFRELRRLGARHAVAARIASNSRRWWRNSRMNLNGVLTVSHFDRLGVPRFS